MDLIIPIVRFLLIGICLWSLLRGNWPEKTGAIIVLTGFTGRLLLSAGGFPLDFGGPNVAHSAFSAILLGVSTWLALRSNRTWTLVFAALMLVEFSGHSSVLIIRGGNSLAYWVTTQLPIIGQVLALGIGTFAFALRKRAGFTTRDWRTPFSGRGLP